MVTQHKTNWTNEGKLPFASPDHTYHPVLSHINMFMSFFKKQRRRGEEPEGEEEEKGRKRRKGRRRRGKEKVRKKRKATPFNVHASQCEDSPSSPCRPSVSSNRRGQGFKAVLITATGGRRIRHRRGPHSPTRPSAGSCGEDRNKLLALHSRPLRITWQAGCRAGVLQMPRGCLLWRRQSRAASKMLILRN